MLYARAERLIHVTSVGQDSAIGRALFTEGKKNTSLSQPDLSTLTL